MQFLFVQFHFNGEMTIYTTFRIYAIIFGLMLFGRDDPWPCLSSVGG